MHDAPAEQPPVHRVTIERSYDKRALAILAFNTCEGDLDEKLQAAWHATIAPQAWRREMERIRAASQAAGVPAGQAVAPAKDPTPAPDHTARLRDALERVTTNFRLVLASKPVRDVEETLAEADAALGHDGGPRYG